MAKVRVCPALQEEPWLLTTCCNRADGAIALVAVVVTTLAGWPTCPLMMMCPFGVEMVCGKVLAEEVGVWPCCMANAATELGSNLMVVAFTEMAACESAEVLIWGDCCCARIKLLVEQLAAADEVLARCCTNNQMEPVIMRRH